MTHWLEDILSNSIIDEIVKIENLHWAWEKAKSFYQKNEHWYDQFEIASFSANYDYELTSIINDIRNNTYTLKPLRPIFFPKGVDENGDPRNRQMFWVSVRDQVTWLAVMNIVGQYYDKQMPFWSYGNRLYVSMFPISKQDDRITWGFGPYRNTTRNTYRSFQQSWPKFRKDIYLTAKLMTSQKEKGLTNEEQADIDDNEHLNEIHKVRYKEKGYWSTNRKDLYWCSIDLRKFYPNAKLEIIERNFNEFGQNIQGFQSIEHLLSILLKFTISYDGLDGFEEEDYEMIGLDGKPLEFNGIPTGLFTAGFLSNVAMLKVDHEAHKLLSPVERSDRYIAQFRFVDDHTFLSTDSNKLFEWVETYKSLMEKYFSDKDGNVCIDISWEKTKPDEYGKYLENKFKPDENFQQLDIESKKQTQQSLKKVAIESMQLDPYYPSALMNMTLEKMSMINNTPFDLLDEEEGKKVITDLEHLLVADFPDEEIRKDTRVSYASSKLAQLTSRVEYDFSEIYFLKNKMILVEKDMKNTEEVFDDTKKKYHDTKKEIEMDIISDRQRVFKLLLFAIHKYPDKLRLWKNALFYCEKNGFGELSIDTKNYKNELIEIWKAINLFERSNDINRHSKVYLISFFYDVIINSLIRVYRTLNTPNLTYREINRKCSYLNQLLSQEFLKGIFTDVEEYDVYYFSQSHNFLKVIIGTIIFLLKDLPQNITEKLELSTFNDTSKLLGLLDWNENPTAYLQEKFKEPDEVVWSIVDKIVDSTSNKPLSFLPIYFDTSSFLSPSSHALAALYPNALSQENILKLSTMLRSPSLTFAWWYELSCFENFPKEWDNLVNEDLKICLEYLDSKGDSESIFSYVENKTLQNESHEISVLRIIKEILERWCNIPLKNFLIGEQEDLLQAFPYNLFIIEDSKIRFQNVNNLTVKDKRYFPDFVDTQAENQEEKYIFAIGVLTFQLLTGNTKLPHSLYLPGAQLFNLNYFLNELEKHPISSYTFEIIESCISKRKRETRIFKRLMETSLSKVLFEDDSKDEWIIFTARDLLNAVSHVLLILEKKRYVFDNNDRYLIPVSLNKIKVDSMVLKDIL